MPGSTGQATQGWLVFVGHKSSAIGDWIRYNASTSLGMGYISNSTRAQNADLNWELWLDKVTWKVATIHRKDTDFGICSFQLDGVAVGTVDGYAAAGSDNNYSEITGISVTTASAKTFKTILSTKNASSTNYGWVPTSHAWIATSQVGASTPGGTDTPGYTWEWIPWMGYKGTTNVNARNQGSDKLGGGTAGNGGTLNDEINTDMWADTGTHKVSTIGSTTAAESIWTLRFDATDIATQDHYSAGGVANVYMETTGIVVATAGVKNFKCIGATKNASSTGYGIIANSFKVIRTGA